MTQKKKTIIILISVFVAFEIVCGIGYVTFNSYFKKMERQEIMTIVSDYIMSDENFAAQYGSVQTISWNDEKQFQKIHGYECVVPCLVTTIDGQVFEVDMRFNFENSKRNFFYDAVIQSD